MRARSWVLNAILAGVVSATAGCSGDNAAQGLDQRNEATLSNRNQQGQSRNFQGEDEDSFFDLFRDRGNPNIDIAINRFLWAASIDVLNFMPVETADPFSGIISFGYGTPPGSGRSYRATVYIRDPALDARSLRVALATRSGPASTETIRAVEDAILTRARQLRIEAEAL